ncbi:hypothetical protein A1D15_2822 [Lactiplantibacillus plantarum]|uniref:hypothetical protein n=1 Tax=Lactiplantibacillus plantarum TaxID=1590 RepID=UPI0007BBC4BF|nr:hypothetical protein [Lactiplantibacillus plantarum]KZU90906.1 hypothetical protein A1D15_2822 [Lactiplantibacillus plantarum]MDV9115390.1 hypothetical protein [Lactiplantibacillus plantarum]
MNIDAQALINKMTSNYAQAIAVKDQQLAMAQVQIDQLTKKLADQHKPNKAKA